MNKSVPVTVFPTECRAGEFRFRKDFRGFKAGDTIKLFIEKQRLSDKYQVYSQFGAEFFWSASLKEITEMFDAYDA